MRASLGLGAALLVWLLAGCGKPQDGSGRRVDRHPDYVGSDACAGCHGKAYAEWRGSHHQRAMLTATDDAVAGDFADAALAWDGVGFAFSRKDQSYLVRAEGADGRLTEFPVRYTFGVEPLQQLLLESHGGRLQAFPVAWDTARRRWFHLQPEHGLQHDDPLHWTGLAYNWNFMCADCHSTAVRKGYDAKTQTYQTEFAEVSVGCEACHGPGSNHVAWAETLAATPPRGFEAVSNSGILREGAVGIADAEKTGSSDRLGLSSESDIGKPPFILALQSQARQINSCAPCHSRREQLADGFSPDKPFLDYYLPALLEPGLYEPDGQILGEVFVYGSFLQSRMHRQGVTCGDCHEPHSAELRTEGNALCTRCHNESGNPNFPSLRPAAYDTPKHHLHASQGAGSRCVSCHLPERTYMMIDRRGDHSFRVPRPDLTLANGVPNACNQCHDDQTAEWAREALERRFGAAEKTNFAPTIAEARLGDPGVAGELAALAANSQRPAIVRATALSLMSAYDDAATALALESGLRDTQALVRIGALRGAARFEPEKRWRRANHLLDDPFRAVRGEAARTLAAAFGVLAHGERGRLQLALDEYLASQRFNADRPEAQTNRAGVFMAIGKPDSAETALQTALSLAPDWVPALVNLADLFRATGRDNAGGPLLERALAVAPEDAEINLARAFWLVRHNRDSEALPLLATAVGLVPHNPRYAYIYAVALHSAGESEQALEVIEAALGQRPGDRQLTRVGTQIARDSGNTERLRRFGSSK